jgi:soluble lytic murein transglycosylase-like protein
MLSPILAKLDATGATIDVAPIIVDAVSGQPLRQPVTLDRLAELAAAAGRVESLWGYARGHAGTTGAAIIGDDGNGEGFMQIDKVAHPALCAGGAMFDPVKNIRAGVMILAGSLQYFAGGADVERRGLAGYNAGPHRVMEAIHQPNGKPDDVTEHRDYTKRIDAALVHFGFATLDAQSALPVAGMP